MEIDVSELGDDESMEVDEVESRKPFTLSIKKRNAVFKMARDGWVLVLENEGHETSSN